MDHPGLRFLALGDSYTIGESVPLEQGWPQQLTTMLRRAGFNFADPTLIARTGWTTDELNAAIDQANLVGSYDLVSLLIGVNNQYRGRDAEQYRTEFTALLGRAVGFAAERPGRVLVLSIPDWGVTPFARQAGRDRRAIATAIDHFNVINRQATERAGVRYVDVTPISREAVNDASFIADDGLHPSGAMYARWARLAYSGVCEMLK